MEQEIKCGKCGGTCSSERMNTNSWMCLRCGFDAIDIEHIQERDRRIEAAAVAMRGGYYATSAEYSMSPAETVECATELIDALDAAAQQRTGGEG